VYYKACPLAAKHSGRAREKRRQICVCRLFVPAPQPEGIISPAWTMPESFFRQSGAPL
jgi:hypothetical protein